MHFLLYIFFVLCGCVCVFSHFSVILKRNRYIDMCMGVIVVEQKIMIFPALLLFFFVFLRVESKLIIDVKNKKETLESLTFKSYSFRLLTLNRVFDGALEVKS